MSQYTKENVSLFCHVLNRMQIQAVTITEHSGRGLHHTRPSADLCTFLTQEKGNGMTGKTAAGKFSTHDYPCYWYSSNLSAHQIIPYCPQATDSQIAVKLFEVPTIPRFWITFVSMLFLFLESWKATGDGCRSDLSAWLIIYSCTFIHLFLNSDRSCNKKY